MKPDVVFVARERPIQPVLLTSCPPRPSSRVVKRHKGRASVKAGNTESPTTVVGATTENQSLDSSKVVVEIIELLFSVDLCCGHVSARLWCRCDCFPQTTELSAHLCHFAQQIVHHVDSVQISGGRSCLMIAATTPNAFCWQKLMSYGVIRV
jgi:hypothetical protein